MLEAEAETNPEIYSQIDDMFIRTRDAAYDIIKRKGNTSFGVGNALARITRAILRNEDVVLPVSALLQGEYGLNDLYIGTPTVLNRTGVRNVVELRLDPDELEKFRHSAKALHEVIDRAEF